MTDITFITSNQTKIAHARYLCRNYDVNILQYKKLFYGVGYHEPRIYDRSELLKESFEDAVKRWKKNVSNYGIIMKRFYTVKRRDENVFIKQATHTVKNVSYGL